MDRDSRRRGTKSGTQDPGARSRRTAGDRRNQLAHRTQISGFWSNLRQLPQRLIVPGGLMVSLIALLASLGVFSSPATVRVVRYCPYIIFAAGLALSAVFRRSRLFFSFLVLTLSAGGVAWIVPLQNTMSERHLLLDAIALLLPVDLLVFAFWHERGIVSSHGKRRLVLIAAQVAAVAVLCIPSVARTASLLDQDFVKGVSDWSRISQPGLLAFLVAGSTLVVLVVKRHRSVESGLLWTSVAAFLAFQSAAGSIRVAVYFSAAGLVLMVALVQTSYAMAYRDELTQLPSRRAFNEALMQLGGSYTIAMVDVDHFKKFNDSFGHEAGDHALRMVSARLARLSGGGKAYRYGGEEFALLFPGKGLDEAAVSAERLRRVIASSSFVVRDQDRRARKGKGWRNGERETSVTVSIGLAECGGTSLSPTDVLKSADKALYRAKAKGRNCVVGARGPRTASRIAVLAS